MKSAQELEKLRNNALSLEQKVRGILVVTEFLDYLKTSDSIFAGKGRDPRDNPIARYLKAYGFKDVEVYSQFMRIDSTYFHNTSARCVDFYGKPEIYTLPFIGILERLDAYGNVLILRQEAIEAVESYINSNQIVIYMAESDFSTAIAQTFTQAVEIFNGRHKSQTISYTKIEDDIFLFNIQEPEGTKSYRVFKFNEVFFFKRVNN